MCNDNSSETGDNGGNEEGSNVSNTDGGNGVTNGDKGESDGDLGKQTALLAATYTSLDQKMNKIMVKLDKLDIIENKLNKLDTKVHSLEGRVKAVETKSKDFELSVKYVSAKCDDFQEKSNAIAKLSTDMAKHKLDVVKDCKAKSDAIEKLSSDLEKQRVEMQKMSDVIKTVTEEKEKLSSTVLDLQCRSMKSNLVFTGLGGEGRDENIEHKLRSFLFHELGIEGDIRFGNIHRFGRHVRGRCRPIVARFLHHQDLTLVRDRAYRLKDTPYGIHEQFPKVIEDKRRELYPIMRQLKREGNNTKLVRDKLYVNGQLYRGPRNDEDRMDVHPSGEQRLDADREQH